MGVRLLNTMKRQQPIRSTVQQRAETFFAGSVEAARPSRERLLPLMTGILAPLPCEKSAIHLCGRMHGRAESTALVDRTLHFEVAASGARGLVARLADFLLLVVNRRASKPAATAPAPTC